MLSYQCSREFRVQWVTSLEVGWMGHVTLCREKDEQVPRLWTSFWNTSPSCLGHIHGNHCHHSGSTLAPMKRPQGEIQSHRHLRCHYSGSSQGILKSQIGKGPWSADLVTLCLSIQLGSWSVVLFNYSFVHPFNTRYWSTTMCQALFSLWTNRSLALWSW